VFVGQKKNVGEIIVFVGLKKKKNIFDGEIPMFVGKKKNVSEIPMFVG
jgi:hypothetical protein